MKNTSYKNVNKFALAMWNEEKEKEKIKKAISGLIIQKAFVGLVGFH